MSAQTDDLLPPETGLEDMWIDEGAGPINAPVAGIAHHHATGHDGGGFDNTYDCEACPFSVDDGMVERGGWARFKAMLHE